MPGADLRGQPRQGLPVDLLDLQRAQGREGLLAAVGVGHHAVDDALDLLLAVLLDELQRGEAAGDLAAVGGRADELRGQLAVGVLGDGPSGGSVAATADGRGRGREASERGHDGQNKACCQHRERCPGLLGAEKHVSYPS